MTVLIKTATIDNLLEIDRINRLCSKENYDLGYWEDILKNGFIKMAVLEEEIIGYIAVLNLENFSRSEFMENFCQEKGITDCVELVSVCVLEKYRNNQIGTKLIEIALKNIPKDYTLVTYVRNADSHEKHIYLKNGFAVYDKLEENYYENPTDNAVIMYKETILDINDIEITFHSADTTDTKDTADTKDTVDTKDIHIDDNSDSNMNANANTNVN